MTPSNILPAGRSESRKASPGYAMFLPLILMIAAIAASALSYSDAKRAIADDLNDAMIALADENRELWTRQDTIAALRQMQATTSMPMIYQAKDVEFRNASLKNNAYFTIALVGGADALPPLRGHSITSDSIVIVPETSADGLAIRIQGFADCSVASVFAAADRTLPGILLTLSVLSSATLLALKRKRLPAEARPGLAIDGARLTPMQRQFTLMLLEAPGMRVDKATICTALWGNKTNAEESLYTLVRRTKAALAHTGIEIVCNRGDSYGLRING